MRTSLATLFAPVLLLALGLGVLIGWICVGGRGDLAVRVPGMDMTPEFDAGPAEIPVVTPPLAGEGVASDVTGSWPWFRGERYDGICHDETPLARRWPATGPEVLWTIEVGEGHAGAAIRDGKVYVLDYDRDNARDVLRCLSLDDGRTIWQAGYPVLVKRNHGMSRTVPAVTEKYVVAMGPKCHLTCFDVATGQCRWIKDLAGEFGATVPDWYAGQCPIVENDLAIVAPGGDSLVVALDCDTGEPVWQSENPLGWVMTHVSILPMDFAGLRTYVYCGKGGVAGVAADDGRWLWDTDAWKIKIATCPSPTLLDDGKLFFSGGYKAGAMLLRLSGDGEAIVPETLERFEPRQFGSEQHTPILYEGHIFGIRERDNELVCMDQSGTEIWASGSAHRFGGGPYLIADGLIFVMNDHGVLTMAEASTDSYKQLGQFQVLDGHDSWGPMAMVAGRLIVRDLTRMACVDVAKDGS